MRTSLKVVCNVECSILEYVVSIYPEVIISKYVIIILVTITQRTIEGHRQSVTCAITVLYLRNGKYLLLKCVVWDQHLHKRCVHCQ